MEIHAGVRIDRAQRNGTYTMDFGEETRARTDQLLVVTAGTTRGRDQAVGSLDYEVRADVLRVITLAPMKMPEALAQNQTASSPQ